VVLDGLLYVVSNANSIHKMTVQIYNPKTNEWKFLETNINDTGYIFAAVAVDRPSLFKTD